MSASSKTSATQSKLEAARAEHAARTAAAQATAEACRTDESEPDFVHAAAIETMVDAAPSWTRRIIGFIAGLFASAATYYYGALAANLLLAMVGPGFLGFVAYLLCIIVLFIASAIAGWATSGLVSGNIALSSVTNTVTGWFKKPVPVAA